MPLAVLVADCVFMKIHREHSSNNSQTYFVTSQTWMRRELFRNPGWARLFMETMQSYRPDKYLLHEFVLMTDHFHLLITPQASLEKAVQFIKGGFSYRAKKELGSNMEVWQRGFSDHRIRDEQDYQMHVAYILGNPTKREFCQTIEEFPYCSRASGVELDCVPQRLKPLELTRV